MPAIWEAHWAFVENLTGRAAVIGEWGGKMSSLTGSVGKRDKAWHAALADYLVEHCLEDTFYWCLNPNVRIRLHACMHVCISCHVMSCHVVGWMLASHCRPPCSCCWSSQPVNHHPNTLTNAERRHGRAALGRLDLPRRGQARVAGARAAQPLRGDPANRWPDLPDARRLRQRCLPEALTGGRERIAWRGRGKEMGAACGVDRW